jgi:hypothetical protein
MSRILRLHSGYVVNPTTHELCSCRRRHETVRSMPFDCTHTAFRCKVRIGSANYSKRMIFDNASVCAVNDRYWYATSNTVNYPKLGEDMPHEWERVPASATNVFFQRIEMSPDEPVRWESVMDEGPILSTIRYRWELSFAI